MMNQKTLDALASSIYVSRLALAGAGVTTDDQRLRASGLYEDWQPGVHGLGTNCNTRNDAGELEQTWECYQAHDTATHPDIRPGSPAWFTFWRPLHGKTPETARPFVHPTHSQDIYFYGEYMIFTDGQIYRCIAPNGTDYSPAEYAPFWEVVM